MKCPVEGLFWLVRDGPRDYRCARRTSDERGTSASIDTPCFSICADNRRAHSNQIQVMYSPGIVDDVPFNEIIKQ